MILALLPLLCLLSSYACAVSLGKREEGGAPRREGILLAGLIWSACACGITELLSLARAVTPTWVAISWGAAAGLMGCAALVARRRTTQPDRNQRARSRLGWTDWLLLLLVALVLALLLVISVASPPITWDTINYHLPRIVHWIQNQALIHFPTHYTPLLYHPPLAEILDLQFLILGGSDLCVSLVRMAFMVGSLVGVSLIVKQLGGGVRGQVAGVVTAATIPPVILQATSGKNSIVAAFFLVCMVHYLLSMRSRLAFGDELAAALGLGLALLTKVTSYLFALPFLVVFGIVLIKRHKIRGAWRPLALLAIVPIALNSGHWYRNFKVFGHPLADPHHSQLLSVEQPVSLARIVSNAMRTATLHLNTPSEALNDYMENAVVGAHKLLGVDPQDPKTSTDAAAYRVFETSTDDGMAASPFHFILLIVSSVLVFSHRKLRLNRWLLGYTAVLLGALLMGPAFLKWSPIIGRLYLPLLVLGAPVIAVVLTELLSRTWSTALFFALVLSSGPWLLYGWPRPLLGPKSVLDTPRDELYYRLTARGLHRSAPKAANWIQTRGFQQIGLHSQGLDYLFWLLLGAPKQSPRIEHVDVGRRGALVEGESFDAFRPEVVIRTHHDSSPFEDQLEFGGVTYSKALSLRNLALYVPQP